MIDGIRQYTNEDIAAWPRVRSNQEHLIMRMLTMLGVRFEYETSRLPLRDGRTYVPDFWLPEIGTYLECKSGGRMWREDKARQAGVHLRRHGLRYYVVRDRSIIHQATAYCWAGSDGDDGDEGAAWCNYVQWIRCGYCHHWQLTTVNDPDCHGCRFCNAWDMHDSDGTKSYAHLDMLNHTAI